MCKALLWAGFMANLKLKKAPFTAVPDDCSKQRGRASRSGLSQVSPARDQGWGRSVVPTAHQNAHLGRRLGRRAMPAFTRARWCRTSHLRLHTLILARTVDGNSSLHTMQVASSVL